MFCGRSAGSAQGLRSADRENEPCSSSWVRLTFRRKRCSTGTGVVRTEIDDYIDTLFVNLAHFILEVCSHPSA